MNKSLTEKNIHSIIRLSSDLFIVEPITVTLENPLFILTPRFETKRSIKILKDRLRYSGFVYQLDNRDEKILLTVSGKRTFYVPIINILLFIITLLSVYIVPVFLRSSSLLTEEQIDNQFIETCKITLDQLANGAGIEFTLALISILFVHEMGHYIASRRRDIITSWPYFIPAPTIIGTLGAVIKSISPFWNRRDLVEVGAAGPIAGWIVAFGWLWYGLGQSTIVPPVNDLLPFEGFSMEGESILVKYLVYKLIGTPPPGYFYYFTEAAFAGWVGILITAINMLPIGQLDGGHIVYGLFKGKVQYYSGVVAIAILLLLGFYSPIWWFFAAFGLFFGIKHPRTMNDTKKLSRVSLLMGIAALMILIVSFTPIPFRL
jgi:hypothetical protein